MAETSTKKLRCHKLPAHHPFRYGIVLEKGNYRIISSAWVRRNWSKKIICSYWQHSRDDRLVMISIHCFVVVILIFIFFIGVSGAVIIFIVCSRLALFARLLGRWYSPLDIIWAVPRISAPFPLRNLYLVVDCGLSGGLLPLRRTNPLQITL